MSEHKHEPQHEQESNGRHGHGADDQHPNHREGSHHREAEVTIRLGDRYGTIVAKPSDSLASIKERTMTALELAASAVGEYVLRFEGHDITDEAQPLQHLLQDRAQDRVEIHLKKRAHVIPYFVNDEGETTTEHHLTVRTILEHASFTPATNYALSSEEPPKDFDSDYDLLVAIHPNQRFRAVAKTPQLVTIFVDNKPVQIPPGVHTIAELKQTAGVALADQLNMEGENGGLIKLDQNGSIVIKGGERFVSFAATGGSS
jgi:hypothetical protein